MILLLKGLANATAVAAKNVKAMKYRVPSIFIKTYTQFVFRNWNRRRLLFQARDLANWLSMEIQDFRDQDKQQQSKQRFPPELLNTKVPWLRAVSSLNS
jgi:hypothetical protein